MDESRFCTECGKPVEAGMQFCPQCGKVISGSAADEEMKKQEKEFGEYISLARRNWLIFVLAIYAIPAIVVGLIALIDAPSSASAIWSSTEFQEWIRSHGITITLADLQSYITYAASLTLGSGVCAMISLILIFLKKLWIIAVATCMMAAILCFWSIFGMFIGFLVTWMIIGAKDIFEEKPEAAE